MIIGIGTNEAGQRLDKFLRKLLTDVPLSAIFKALRKGDIRINGKKQKENYALQLNDIIEIKYLKSNQEEIKQKPKFIKVDATGMKVMYEDDNLIIVEKWPGVLIHPDQKSEEPTLTDYVLSYLNEKGSYLPDQEVTFTPASCNRLDRNTSGIVMFGKTFEGLRSLNEMIREGNVEKYYMTLVTGKVKDGIYTGYIKKNEDVNISKVYDEEIPNSKKIAMEIKTVQTNSAYSLVEIDLITGRSHQIRAHMAHLGHGVIGDNKYGNKKLNSFFANKFGLNYQFLYAYKLVFRNAPGKMEYLNNKTVAAALPPIFKKIKSDVFKFR